ncbi:elongation factor 2 kinase, putative, partial [Schistosoma mansoni]
MEGIPSESTPVDLFPQALPKIPSNASCLRYPRKLSVREIKIQRSEDGNKYAAITRHSRAKALWKTALSLISSCGDPWEKFHLQELPEETAKRYRYNAIRGKWIEDIVHVKIENSPFNRGAMRECFRAKKLSNFSHCSDWSHASNHVAKRYIEKVENHVYFDDVRLQMDAKLWGEEYSRQPSAPKKVDISQTCVLEFINRPEKPLYHLEHFIEGTYRKYNSNSGFVDDLSRNTPQAFSHFTFERSGHRLIVVDIQGVGNLWTDPQIHTFNGKSYGDGNLGIRGMALFFYTHRCNPLCLALSLSPFDLPISEKLSTPLSQLSMKAEDNQTENIDGISDNNNVELSGTVAIPASRRDRYGIRRLVSENIDSSYDLRENANKHNNDTSSDFVDPSDFVESHSVPSPKLPFLPSRSPVSCRKNILQKTDQINDHNSNVVNNGKHSTKYNTNTTTTGNNINNNDARTNDLIFGPISLHNNSNDSGISFDGPSFGSVFKAQKSLISDPGCDPVCSDLDQSNSHLNSTENSQQLSK